MKYNCLQRYFFKLKEKRLHGLVPFYFEIVEEFFIDCPHPQILLYTSRFGKELWEGWELPPNEVSRICSFRDSDANQSEVYDRIKLTGKQVLDCNLDWKSFGEVREDILDIIRKEWEVNNYG